jgi:hypothetical protein
MLSLWNNIRDGLFQSPLEDNLSPDIKVMSFELLVMALVQKGLIFHCLTIVSVMLERSEASQGEVKSNNFTFLHPG